MSIGKTGRCVSNRCIIMWSLRAILTALTGAVAVALDAAAETVCQSDWVSKAMPFSGSVAGADAFRVDVSDGLVFILQPDEAGWHVEMAGAEDEVIPTRPVASGIPPVRGKNRPTEKFVFGSGMLDPARNPELTVPVRPPIAATVEPAPGKQGQGWFTVTDQAFSDGSAPRRVFMAFEGCVLWNDGPRKPDVSHYPSAEDLADFPIWVTSAFEDCGLPDTLLLSGRMRRAPYPQAVWLEPDIDGDGRPDLVALVDTISGDRHGLAVCLQAGKKLLVQGMEPDDTDTPLSSDFLIGADWWSVEGRTVVVGHEGAGSLAVYIDEAGSLASEWRGD